MCWKSQAKKAGELNKMCQTPRSGAEAILMELKLFQITGEYFYKTLTGKTFRFHEETFQQSVSGYYFIRLELIYNCCQIGCA